MFNQILPLTFDTSTTTMVFNISEPAVDRINKFRNLKPGWDYGVGGPISEYVIERAIKAYRFLKDNIFDWEITPNSDDTIQLTFSYIDDFFDIIISKAKFSFKHEKGIGNDFNVLMESGNLSLEKIKKELDKIILKCSSYVQFISQNSVGISEDLMIALPTLKVEYLYLKGIVPKKSQEAYAIISENSTAAQLMYP